MKKRCVFKHCLSSLTGVVVCSSFLACASLPANENNCVYGIVTDSTSSPVKGYVIKVNDKFECLTNEQGVFVLKNADLNDISFSGEKKGYESISVENKRISQTDFLCLEVMNLEEIISLATLYLKNSNVKKADEILQRLGSANDDNGRVLLLKAVTAMRMERYDQTKNYLSKLKVFYWSSALSDLEMLLETRLLLNESS